MSKYEKIDEFFLNIDEKIDDFLDHVSPIYRVVPGYLLGIIGVFVASISILAAFLLYMTVDPSFTPFTHWISHLGIGPNGSNIVFNIGISVSSVFLFLFYLHHIKEFRKLGANKTITDCLLVSVIATCAGLIFIAIFPYNITLLHGIAANVFFLGGLNSCLLYSVLIIITPKVSKLHAIVGFVSAALFIFHILNSVITSFTIKLQTKEFDAELTKFSEWLALFAILLLIVENIVSNFVKNYSFHKRAKEFLIDSNHHFSNENIYKLRKFVKILKH
ncbi:MAG: DUF998 domain-containing protein [Candidatus Lokiarchaeota archaeon]|nr:DUF998 domain-containing protein [Candidatus Lokiarchaeota archaeon]